MWILVMVKPNVVFKYYMYTVYIYISSHFTPVQTITDYKLKVLLCHSHRNSQFYFRILCNFTHQENVNQICYDGTYTHTKMRKKKN